MNSFLLFLRRKIAPFLESKLFAWLFGIVVFFSPVAIGLQLLKAVTAPLIEGIAIETYVTFTTLQIVALLYGIEKKDWRIFIACSISCLEAIAIIIILLIRGEIFF